MAASYNGYSPKQRGRLSAARRAIETAGNTALEYLRSGLPCEMCDDPYPPPASWHSEDYSMPFTWKPPATYIVCSFCHSHLHKRFNQSKKWSLFVLHLKAGGYGREFITLRQSEHWRGWSEPWGDGAEVALPTIRERHLSGKEWWLNLTLDPDSRDAAWARPRPYFPRPGPQYYRKALAAAAPAFNERSLLKYHAQYPNRSLSMRQLACDVLGTKRPGTANLLYGKFAHRMAMHLAPWLPEYRSDGSAIWMTSVAEGWQPKAREYEWVMIKPLAQVVIEDCLT